MTIGTEVAMLQVLKDQIKVVQTDLKDLEAQKRELEDTIMTTLTESGSSLARTESGTVSIITENLAQVVDWPEFYDYVQKNEAFYLLQRRVSNPAWRDECGAKGMVPGTATFTKHKLSFTNKTS